MDTVRVGTRYRFLAATALMLLAVAASAAANGDAVVSDDWQKRALALNDITGDNPIKGEIKKLTADAAGAKKLLAAAVPMAREKSQPFNYNAAYILARVAVREQDLEAGKVFYRICADQAAKLKSGNKLGTAYGGLIDLLYEHKKYEESEKVCKEFLEMEDEDGQARRFKGAVMMRMIQAIAKQHKSDDAMKLVNNLLKARPDDWLILELKGWVEVEGGKEAEAAKTYEKVLDLIGKDKSLKDEEKAEFSELYHYKLSGIYVDLNQIDKAADQLKGLLAKKPNDSTYNNDLGYIWADHDMNLAEAEKLIRKAIEQDRKDRKAAAESGGAEEKDKDNPAYLDSLGWVLYKNKKYKEAVEPLEAAVRDKDGRHIEIYDHLGDVYMALGEKDKAVEAWKKGLETAGTSKREQDRKAIVEKKLKEKQAASK